MRKQIDIPEENKVLEKLQILAIKAKIIMASLHKRLIEILHFLRLCITCCVWVVWNYEALPYQITKNLNRRTNYE